MEVKIVDSTKDRIKFEIHGTDHAMMNLLRDKLAKTKGVDFATYSQPHPLIEGFMVTVRGDDPEKLVKRALSEVKSDMKEVKAAMKAAK